MSEIIRNKLLIAIVMVISAVFVVNITQTNAVTTPITPNVQRVTGADLDTCIRWDVCGTDLGIPYQLENGSFGYLFGDTFSTRNPEDPQPADSWRSPVMLRSSVVPGPNSPIVFDSAAKIQGNGHAPEIMPNGHRQDNEFSVIPNDGIGFPETGDQIISYQSIRTWDIKGDENWQTNYSGLAWSPNGNDFYRIGPTWQNDSSNNDPFQMQSMQRDGDYVYIISVRAGRQNGPMMLQRVAWDKMFYKEAFECWNGSSWGGVCQPILQGRMGEPSLRKIGNVWAMSYLNINVNAIVTRAAYSPTGPWSSEKVQVANTGQNAQYGGFIHPASTSDNLTMMVSSWQHDIYGRTLRYDVSSVRGTLQSPPSTSLR